jgi:hypothetical protein
VLASNGNALRETLAASEPSSATQVTSDKARGFLEPIEIALLIVWCFIAGFSEQLIPGLLATTEARAGSPAPSTDRFRPTVGATQVPPPATPNTNTSPAPAPSSQSTETAPKPKQGPTT